MLESGIIAIGTASPQYYRNQLETAELIISGVNLSSAEKRLLKSVYRATGIHKRHSVLSDYCKSPGEFEIFPNDAQTPFPSTSVRMRLYKENALTLALTAIENCLNSLDDFNKKEITHVITVSCTGMYAPGLDIEIVHSLQLNSHTQRVAVNFMGCYGAFNAIKLSDAICKAEPNAKVLIVSVELCTLHFQNKFDLSNIIANSIFADGAAAILVEAIKKPQKYFSLTNFYCDLLPQASKEMTWHIGNNGFDIVLSSYVPEVIRSGISSFFDKLFAQTNNWQATIDFYAIHPGGLKILQACEEALNISELDNRYAYQVLREFGNMSSATILFVLKNIWEDLKSTDTNKYVFSCAFGPGLTLESMLLRVNCL